jgi:H+/Cl- antiporter ClcA
MSTLPSQEEFLRAEGRRALNDARGLNSARSAIVNRTHRVVREQALNMQEQRDKSRSLMLPLMVCSVLLILMASAVWSGLYQYEAAEAVEAVQADVAALATADANNHFLVVLLWFVPVSVALLVTLWVRRSHKNTNDESL